MSYKNVPLDESIIIKNRIPLLIRDENWLKLFSKYNNKVIVNLKEELSSLINEKKALEREESKLKEEKLLAMKMILGISNSINNENKIHNLALLDEYKDKIENINKQLDELSEKKINIHEEIMELNFELLKATVYYGYKDLKKREKQLKDINEELDRIRQKTRELINQKHDYQEWIQAVYTFLHGLLGREEIEKLDKKILE